ncbi:DUF551 domain-containing protein [Klebsiella pneumoniae]
MTSKFSIDNRELLQRISSGEAVVGIDFGNLIVRELAAFRLAAMDSEPHTDDELSNLLWYSQEATCHSDPNYYCEFQRLATPGLIAGIIRELQERRKADSEPVAEITEDLGRLFVKIHYPTTLRAGDKLYRHAQPAQVVPDGYVMVPKEPTEEMLQASYREAAVYSPTAYRAMIAAAKHDTPAMNSVQSVVTVPGKWIPVSERMPELGEWLVTDGCDFDVQLFNGEQFIPGFVWEDKITHWMPLPAAPQEAQGE